MILLGFQMAGFSWRLTREIAIRNQGGIAWLPPAEILNIIAMLINCLGVFVLPLSLFANSSMTFVAFGVSVILFAGFPVALAGHYNLFISGNRAKPRDHIQRYFTGQEKVAIIITIAVAALFVGLRKY
jgi:membrane protein implicated in regulation of membrane protease activity